MLKKETFLQKATKQTKQNKKVKRRFWIKLNTVRLQKKKIKSEWAIPEIIGISLKKTTILKLKILGIPCFNVNSNKINGYSKNDAKYLKIIFLIPKQQIQQLNFGSRCSWCIYNAFWSRSIEGAIISKWCFYKAMGSRAIEVERILWL